MSEEKLNTLDLSALDGLSPEERDLALSILKEYSESGSSEKLNELVLEDYAEIPVDIETFVDNDQYLGNAWHDSEGKTKLYPYWRKELKKIFPDNLTTNVNNAIFSGSRGRGKAQPLDAKVFTDSGYRQMGSLKIGDKVYGSDGKLHPIIGIYPQGKKKVYKLTFSDGSQTRCSDEHLWKIKYKQSDWKVVELKDILDTEIISAFGAFNYQIPVTKCLDFPEKEVNLENFQFNNGIPLEYIINSKTVREQVLNKLRNQFESENKFFYINKQLAKDIQLLVETLGGVVSFDAYRYDNADIKIDLDNPARYISNIEYIGIEECQCIMVDSEEHLYLTDDLIVTHNTEVAILIASYLLHRILCLKDPVAYFHLKPTEKIVFAFMNIKLALAEEIGIAKFQNTIQSSPWFMDHGTIEGRTRKIWVPQKFNGQEAIDIKIGSQADDLIGLPIYFCLDPDTIIKTVDGDFKIKDLENKTIRVPGVDENGNIVISNECTVKPTQKSKVEYQIELEDGSVIKCTPEHRFMLKDGTYKEAQYLTEEDDLLEYIPYGYIYKTTNTINGKIYIGQKKSDKFLHDMYLGSGDLIRKSIKKYGKSNFKVELLEFCRSKQELDSKEQYWISYYHSQDLNIGYNIANGGQGGDGGQIIRQKISTALKGRPKDENTKEKISKTLKAKHLHHTVSEEVKLKISIGNKGQKRSEATKYLMHVKAKERISRNSNSTKGKIAINNGDDLRYIDPNTPLPEGYVLGNNKNTGNHNMDNYYSSPELIAKRKQLASGSNNNMYGKGYKISGGKNGSAKTDYWFENLYFDCRKALHTYLINQGYYIPISIIRNLEFGKLSERQKRKYANIIPKIQWREKLDENIKNNQN